MFALQDEITQKVVAAIEPKLLEAEGVRSQNRSAEDLGAWDMVIHANSLFWRLTKTEGDAAITMLWRAVERYPDNGPAHSMLAFMMLLSQLTGWNIDEALGKQAATLAARAAELDDRRSVGASSARVCRIHDAADRCSRRRIRARPRP